MPGEKDLRILLTTLKPKHNPGDFVFCCVNDLSQFRFVDLIAVFKEAEGYTIIIKKELADRLNVEYSFVAAWISLTVHSSLQAVGLTAAVATALSKEGISCNVIAAFYHDHIFVDKKDAEKAIMILDKFAAE